MDLVDIGAQLTILTNRFCYFNKPQDDQFYNVFVSKRIKGDNFNQRIYFKLEKVRGKTEKENFEAKKTLEDGTGKDRPPKLFSISKLEQKGGGEKRHANYINTFTEEIGSQQDPNFFQGDNDVPKKQLKKKAARSNYNIKSQSTEFINEYLI